MPDTAFCYCGKAFDVRAFPVAFEFDCNACGESVVVGSRPPWWIHLCACCSAAMDVRGLKPGSSASCTHCAQAFVVPGEAAVPVLNEAAAAEPVEVAREATAPEQGAPQTFGWLVGDLKRKQEGVADEPESEASVFQVEGSEAESALLEELADANVRASEHPEGSDQALAEVEALAEMLIGDEDVPEPPPPEPPKRLIVLCKECIARVDVSGMAPGETLPCPDCGTQVQVPDTASMGQTKPGDEIGRARVAFSAFYRNLVPDPDPSAGPDTQPTARVRRDAPAERKALAEALQASAEARTVAKPPPLPRGLVWSAIALVSVLPLTVLGVYLKARFVDMPALQARGEPSAEPPPPPQYAEYLTPGADVEVVGLLSTVDGAVARDGRQGALLQVNGCGQLWVEDGFRRHADLFAAIAERHATRSRTALQLRGRLAPLSEMQSPPSGISLAGHGLYLQIRSAAFCPHHKATANPVGVSRAARDD